MPSKAFAAHLISWDSSHVCVRLMTRDCVLLLLFCFCTEVFLKVCTVVFIFVLVYKAISLSVFYDSWTLACFCTRCVFIWCLHNMLFICCQLVLKSLKPNVTLTAFIWEFVRFLDAYHRTSGSDSYLLIFEAIQNALDEISCS